MNIREEAEAIFETWTDGCRSSAISALKKWDPLAASAICVQLVLMLLDETDDLPDFVEQLETAMFNDNELKVGEVMED
jgi:hypothetical protein